MRKPVCGPTCRSFAISTLLVLAAVDGAAAQYVYSPYTTGVQPYGARPYYGAPAYGVPGQQTGVQPGIGAQLQMPGQTNATFVDPAVSQAPAAGLPVDPPGGLGGYNAPGGMGSGIRRDLLSRAARRAGLRAGFQAECSRLTQSIEQFAADFDRRFDFTPMIVDGTIVPPVITEVREVAEQKNAGLVYLSLGTYRIVSQARLALKLPSWRDYLVLSKSYGSRSAPDFPPRTDEELRFYEAEEARGREDGISDARELFEVNLSRLERDYKGMKLYHELAAAGAVSLPKIQRHGSSLSLSDGGQRASVGNMEVKLLVTPSFQRASTSAYLGNRKVPPRPMPKPVPKREPVASSPFGPPPAGPTNVVMVNDPGSSGVSMVTKAPRAPSAGN